MREAICMKAVNIKLSLAENVKTFVNIANRYPYVDNEEKQRY